MISHYSGGIALVTGASRGIGRAIARMLCIEGMKVDTVARDVAALERLRDECLGHRGEIRPRICDLSDHQQIETLTGGLDTPSVIVNAAGWAAPRTPIAHSAQADSKRTLEVCLYAPVAIIQGMLPGMLAAERAGAIIQILSPAARRGRAGEAAYAAAKAGLRGFTQALRAELHTTEIKVVALYPGHVDTDLIPANRKVDRSRFLQPLDVADAVRFCLATSPRCCPEELVIEPQMNPFRSNIIN